MTIAIGLDIGGTKISAAFIVGQELVQASRRDYQRASLVDDIAALHLELSANREAVDFIGISCAGLVDSDEGVVRFAGNLSLDNFHLAKEVEAATGVRTLIDNDARCATLGEFNQAHGALGANVAGIILGTGVGGGLVLNSRPIRGKNGFAGELGHLSVSNPQRPCACGLFGCLESVAGGRSFEADYFALTGDAKTGEQIADLARLGNDAALTSFMRVGQAVGEVIAQLDNALDLDSVVIGGGFGGTLDLWRESAWQSYENNLVGASRRSRVQIVPAKLGNQAALHGAAALSQA